MKRRIVPHRARVMHMSLRSSNRHADDEDVGLISAQVRQAEKRCCELDVFLVEFRLVEPTTLQPLLQPLQSKHYSRLISAAVSKKQQQASSKKQCGASRAGSASATMQSLLFTLKIQFCTSKADFILREQMDKSILPHATRRTIKTFTSDLSLMSRLMMFRKTLEVRNVSIPSSKFPLLSALHT